MDLRPFVIDRRAVWEKPSLLRSYFWRCQDDVGYSGTIRRDGCFVIEAKLTLLEGEIVGDGTGIAVGLARRDGGGERRRGHGDKRGSEHGGSPDGDGVFFEYRSGSLLLTTEHAMPLRGRQHQGLVLVKDRKGVGW